MKKKRQKKKEAESIRGPLQKHYLCEGGPSSRFSCGEVKRCRKEVPRAIRSGGSCFGGKKKRGRRKNGGVRMKKGESMTTHPRGTKHIAEAYTTAMELGKRDGNTEAPKGKGGIRD